METRGHRLQPDALFLLSVLLSFLLSFPPTLATFAWVLLVALTMGGPSGWLSHTSARSDITAGAQIHPQREPCFVKETETRRRSQQCVAVEETGWPEEHVKRYSVID